MKDVKVQAIELLRIKQGKSVIESDLLAVEEPLEIRIGYGEQHAREQKSLSVTMRTPGNDFELAAGFLFTEGIISDFSDIEHIHYCKTAKEEEQRNILRVELGSSVAMDWQKLQRHFYTSSSCGVCGKSSIEAVEVSCSFNSDPYVVEEALIYELPDKLTSHQPVFNYTGALHASVLLDGNGELLFVREDVGRHNALDKVIGAMVMAKELTAKLLVVSGRLSFELVQKAAIAQIPVIVAVGAPSSLAVELAKNLGITLIGFTKKDRFNIYSGKQRIRFQTGD
ncbi:MAG: formate dehydrogenase accessory sulfurtransferase FdhD [Candidatus Cyclobacteriaceae bacterium M2_1C_046]